MAQPRVRRTVRTGAALLAASVVSLGLALPAHAADTSAFALVVPGAQTLLPQSGGATAAVFRTITTTLLSEGPAETLTDVKVAIDASRLKGLAELSLPGKCAFTADDPAHLHALCSLGSVDRMGTLGLGIRSLTGAAVGAKGSITFTATASNATVDTDPGISLGDGPATPYNVTPVTIGDGPDLAVSPLGDLDVPAGGTQELAPTVANLGDRDAKGVVMYLDAQSLKAIPSQFALTGNYSNCVYGYGDPEGDPADNTGVLCSFPGTVVKPGQTYRLSSPALVSATAKATKGYAEYGFDVLGGDLGGANGTGKAGTGAALTLVPVQASTAPAARAVPDIDYGDNTAVSTLSTGHLNDLAVTAGPVHGTVGKVSTFRAAVTNKGTEPSVPMDGAPSPKVTAVFVVVFPKGVTVTSTPSGCLVQDLSQGGDLARSAHATGRLATLLHRSQVRALDAAAAPGAGYVCMVQQVLKPRQQIGFSFGVEPTTVLNRAVGAVGVLTSNDDNSANDFAEFTVDAAKAAATAPHSAPASAPASTGGSGSTSSGSTAGSGGALAATGGGGDALPIALGGAAAVLVGAGGVLLARRRRLGQHG